MLQGFKKFILRGNVIELAVAVMIGAAFNAIATKVVEPVFNPLISSIFNAYSLNTGLVVKLPGGAQLLFGADIGTVINFILVAADIYFVFVAPMNALKKRSEQEAPVAVG